MNIAKETPGENVAVIVNLWVMASTGIEASQGGKISNASFDAVQNSAQDCEDLFKLKN